jgi:hypothetical protein
MTFRQPTSTSQWPEPNGRIAALARLRIIAMDTPGDYVLAERGLEAAGIVPLEVDGAFAAHAFAAAAFAAGSFAVAGAIPPASGGWVVRIGMPSTARLIVVAGEGAVYG